MPGKARKSENTVANVVELLLSLVEIGPFWVGRRYYWAPGEDLNLTFRYRSDCLDRRYKIQFTLILILDWQTIQIRKAPSKG